MFKISYDTPAYYLTSVAKDRLTVFKKSQMADLAVTTLNEARKSGNLLIFAYVVMPDHLHAILGSNDAPSRVAKYVNGISARRVIDYLKENNFNRSLSKLAHHDLGFKYRYSLWDHHSNIKRLVNEDVFMQKVNYLHQNPVRSGIVNHPMDYRWSSVRCWAGKPLESEPLDVDIEKIHWSHRK